MKVRIQTGVATLAVAAGFATAATAQDGVENTESGERQVVVLEEIIVTAGAPAAGSSLVQAARIDVLEGLEKELRQGASLGQTLEYLPGVRVLDTGNNAGVPIIRGLTGNRVRVLSNGIGIDYQQYGIRHQPTIEPALSERIEVVRGSASLLYGSDAIGGVIDVRGPSLAHSDDGTRRNRLGTRIDYFTNNEQRNITLQGASLGDRFSVAGGYVLRDGDDINAPNSATAFESGDSSGPAFTGRLPFTDFRQQSAQGGLSYRGEQATTTLRASWWDIEQNYLLPVPPDGRGIGLALENFEVQLASTMKLDTDNTLWELRPSLSYSNNLRQANQPGNPRSELFDGAIEIEFDQYVARLEASHEGGSLFDRGTVGFELRQRDQYSRGTTVLSPGGKVTAAGIFAYEEKRLDRLLLQAGLRFDYLEIEGDADRTTSDPGFSGIVNNSYNVVSGALGGSYLLSEHFTLAANLARGFRAPELFELFARGVHGGVAAVQLGNPDLDPETALNFDLSLRWAFPRARGAVTVYQNRIDDYIFLTDTGTVAGNGLPVFVHDQADATLTGLEGELTLLLADDWSLRFVLDLIDTENRRTGENLPLTPAHEARTELTWQPQQFKGLKAPYLRAGLRFADSQKAAPSEPFQQFDNNPNFGGASTDSYWLVDLAAGTSFAGPGGRDVRVNLEVRNLLDETYRDFTNSYKAYALNPGRDFRLTLQVPLD